MIVTIIENTSNPLSTIYSAARTCYSIETTKKIHKDRGCSKKKKLALVDAIIKMGHHSVLEHVNITIGIDGISRACSHQLIRHRIASYSQQSQRYVKFGNKSIIDYVTPESIEKGSLVEEDFDNFMQQTTDFYRFLIDRDVTPEDARFVLPNACCTNMIMTVNARQLIEMSKARLCTTAQWEIRDLFESIKILVKTNKHLSFLHQYLKSKCDWLGVCPESDRCCGRYKTTEGDNEKST